MSRAVGALGALLAVSLAAAALTPTRASAAWIPAALSDSLGTEIDSRERDAYRLFPDVDGFVSARFEQNDGARRVTIERNEGGAVKRREARVSRESWEATRLHVELVERATRSGSSPVPGGENEAQYRLALRFAAQGRYDVARPLLEDLSARSLDEPFAAEVRATSDQVRQVAGTRRGLYSSHALFDQSGRADLLVFSGLYGIWAGVAVPIFFEADGSAAYAAGFLIAPGASILLASSLSAHSEMGVGRAAMISMGGWLGTWQGVGWSALGDADGNDVVGFGLVSGLAGITAASLVTNKVQFSEGHGVLTGQSWLWGGWFGLCAGIAGGLEGDARLRASLIGSDALVLGTAIAARNVRMSKNRARLITLAGIAGTAFGFGVVLLGEVDDDQAIFAIAGAGSAAGLALGAKTTRGYDRDRAFSSVEPAGDDWGIELTPRLSFAKGRGAAKVPLVGVTVRF